MTAATNRNLDAMTEALRRHVEARDAYDRARRKWRQRHTAGDSEPAAGEDLHPDLADEIAAYKENRI